MSASSLAIKTFIIQCGKSGCARDNLGKVVLEMRFNHITHEHGIVNGAGDRQTSVGQQMLTALGVKKHFCRSARKPGGQMFADRLCVSIRSVLMHQGDISRTKRIEGKG